jgi:putative ABC transport system permease protein
LKEDGWIYILFFSFALIVGIITGLLPAAYLSGFKPVLVLKNAVDTAVRTKFSLKKILMVVQFSLSLIFVIGVLFIYHQVQFMLSANYGINEKNILNLHLQGEEYEKYANEIRNVSGVQRVGAVSHSLGTSQDRATDYKRNKTDQAFVMRDFCADADYLKNLQVKFVAGRNFKTGLSKEKESEVILNETALTSFGFTNAHAALDQTIYTDDSLQLQVVGIVQDFHFRTFENAIGPLAFRYRPADFNLLSIAYDPAAKNRVIEATQSIWKKYDPVHTIQCRTMEDEIDQAYVESGYNDIVKILAYISFLAITIACLGMLGMVMYSTQLKVKEIGVRKMLGASVKDVTVLLSKSFIKLIAISTLIGIPSGYFLGNLFLQNFPYRISDAPLLVLFAILITGSAAIITICSQTIKAAIVNPVHALRTE